MQAWIKLTIMALVLMLAFLGSNTASAQGKSETAFVHMCDDFEPMLKIVIKFGTKPLVVGKGVAKHVSGAILTGNVTVWLHPDGDNFIITLDNGEVACIISSGTNMYPYTAPDQPL
jgi:hypothetical protein